MTKTMTGAEYLEEHEIEPDAVNDCPNRHGLPEFCDVTNMDCDECWEKLKVAKLEVDTETGQINLAEEE